MRYKRYDIIFSSLSLKFKCKICVQKEEIHNFENHILVTWPATNLLIFKKMVWVWKTKSLLFCLRYDPLIIFQRQNHITFIFIKTMSHDLLSSNCLFHSYIILIGTYSRGHITCLCLGNEPSLLPRRRTSGPKRTTQIKLTRYCMYCTVRETC